MPTRPPPVSIVVPFLGSEEDGRAAMARLAALATSDRDEVVFVDNTPTGVLEGLDGGPGLEIVAAPQQRSAFFARNAGAARAGGEWLLFLDADCLPPARLLDRYFDPTPGERVGIVAGELVGDQRQDALAARWARSRRGLIASHHLELGPRPAGTTANMLVRRAAFERVGGFESGARSDADVELCWRIQEAGWGFEYRPEALVVHRDPERLPAVLRQAAGYGAGRRWTNRLYPGSGTRPPLLRPLSRAVGGSLVWAIRGERERAAFKLIDGAAAAARWWGYLAVSNSSGGRVKTPGVQPPGGARAEAGGSMRVLAVGNMYPPHHLGGYELTWRAAVEALRAAGHEVRVLTTDFRVAEPDATIPEDPEARRELRWYWSDHGWPRISTLQRLRLERHNKRTLEAQLREFRPDVVNWWAMGGMSLSLIERVRRRGLPAVGVVGDEWMRYGPLVDAWQRAGTRLGPLRGLAGALAGVPMSVDLGAAATWLFNSEFTRRHAITATGALPRSAVAHPGIPPELFAPAPAPEWRGRLLYVGRIDPRKGTELAVRALSELEGAELTLLGHGDDAHLGRLRALVASHGLEGRVRFARRPRGELRAAYADADAVVFPALWEEPWGLVPLEAMAVGTPVVASGTGGSAEYLRDGVNCLLFEADRGPAGLAAAIRRLRDEPELRSRLREGGLETASRYTEAAYNEAIRAALERAVAGRVGS